jgi:hypothetical protein
MPLLFQSNGWGIVMRVSRGVVGVLVVVLVGLGGPAQVGGARADETLSPATFVDPRQLAEGSPAACVVDAVHQGLTVAQAVDACHLRSLELPTAKGVNSFLATGGGLGRGTSKHGSVTCAPTGTDPRISADGGTKGLPPHYYGKDRDHLDKFKAPPGPMDGWRDPEYKQLQDRADQAWREYYQALHDAAMNDTFGKNPEADAKLHQKLEQESREMNEALRERDAWRPDVSDIPPDAVDTCSDLRSFVAECNRDGWITPACAEVERRMRGCADPTITRPGPDATEVCPPGEPDPETVERVATLYCSRAVHPAPGEDPCGTTGVDATILRGYVHDAGDPCGDPRAMPGQDQCAPVLTVTTFGRTTMEDIVRIGIEKLGGPVFVVPLTPPGPIGPGPK